MFSHRFPPRCRANRQRWTQIYTGPYCFNILEIIRTDPIPDATTHRAALTEIEGLKQAAVGTPDGDRLGLLINLVEAYEAQHFPIAPPERSPLQLMESMLGGKLEFDPPKVVIKLRPVEFD